MAEGMFSDRRGGKGGSSDPVGSINSNPKGDTTSKTPEKSVHKFIFEASNGWFTTDDAPEGNTDGAPEGSAPKGSISPPGPRF